MKTFFCVVALLAGSAAFADVPNNQKPAGGCAAVPVASVLMLVPVLSMLRSKKR